MGTPCDPLFLALPLLVAARQQVACTSVVLRHFMVAAMCTWTRERVGVGFPGGGVGCGVVCQTMQGNA